MYNSFALNTDILYIQLYRPHWIMYNSLHSIHVSSTCNYTNHTGLDMYNSLNSIHLSSTCNYTNHTGSCTTVYTQYIYPVHVIIPTTLDHMYNSLHSIQLSSTCHYTNHTGSCTTVYTQYS